MGLESKLEQQQNQESALIKITLVSEEMRKLFSEQLRECGPGRGKQEYDIQPVCLLSDPKS